MAVSYIGLKLALSGFVGRSGLIETCKTDPGVPGAILGASTCVLGLVWLGVPVPIWPAIVVVSVVLWPCCHGREDLWQVLSGSGLTPALAFAPGAVFGLVYAVSFVAVISLSAPPGGWLAPVGLFGLGFWLSQRANQWYVAQLVEDQSPLVTWQARKYRDRRQIAFAVGVVFVAVTLSEYYQTAPTLLTLNGAALIYAVTNALFILIGGVIGTVIGRGFRLRRRKKTFTAYENGIQINSAGFLHRDELVGYDITDTEVVLQTDRLYGKRRLRLSDIENLSQVRETLERRYSVS
ncbi:MAG: hypothetical protein ABEI77_01750 [Halorientalis sp.]